MTYIYANVDWKPVYLRHKNAKLINLVSSQGSEVILARLLFAIFLIVPLIEIALFVSLGQLIGLWPTLAGVVITALIGSAIIRAQGLSLFKEIQRLSAAGELPAKQLAEAMMLGISGALLLTPGYFTDLVGFILLVPGIRVAIYTYLKSRIQVVSTASFSARRPPKPDNSDTINLDRDDWRDDD